MDQDIGTLEFIATFIVATGALGTAAFGIVDALKWTPMGLAGFKQIGKVLGTALQATLERAYGEDCEALLKALYRRRRGKGDLPRTLRQGVRIGLTKERAAEVARSLPGVDAAALEVAAGIVAEGKSLDDDDQRRALGRFELAVDAKIDAALALAENRYVGMSRLAASGVAMLIAWAAGIALVMFSQTPPAFGTTMVTSTFVGLASVPVAPIAKDLASGFSSATRALKAKP